AGAPQVALGSAGGRGSEGRSVEDVYIGRAILRGDEAGEVETRVLHDDRWREHGPAWRIAVAAADQRSGGKEEGGAAHAASLPCRAHSSQSHHGTPRAMGTNREDVVTRTSTLPSRLGSSGRRRHRAWRLSSHRGRRRRGGTTALHPHRGER